MRQLPSSAIALAIACCLACSANAATNAAAAALTTSQLPRDVRPEHYEVRFVPDADALSFDGQVAITLEVLEPTARITLNAVDMRFRKVSLRTVDDRAQPLEPLVAIDAAAQTATFTFAEPLAKGRYQLSMDYSGKIGTQANGLFAIDYDTPKGKRRALYTQFENADARKFIPSWDEPNYKATFDMTVTAPAGQMAVSNMPITEVAELADGSQRVSFASSPKMSTYLLFFGLGDFERATLQAGETEIGVLTQTGLIAQARFALESSRDLLREYNDYFGVPYPLPKLDNVAAPGRSQFFGAMENWGAIFTFEHALLLNPAISTQADRQGSFSITAHEIAHQWFGNLVTMSWWDDLWLNEGFATWMAGRITTKLHPEWNSALRVVKSRETAFALDALATTHPVVTHIETVEQASQAFDAITYRKGAAVIGMLEAYVGEDAWRQGVRNYMQKHAYGNTVSDDLWREIQAAAGKPIMGIAHDFTLQAGVPLIRAESSACVEGKSTLKLVQSEFSQGQPDLKSRSWRVPVIAQVLGAAPTRTLVENGKASIELDSCEPVIVNAGQSGYYRTLYASDQFDALREHFAELPAIDQLGLLSDSWALGLAGEQPVPLYFDLVQTIPTAADPQVWGNVVENLAAFDGYYAADGKRREAYRSYARQRLQPLMAQIGWQAAAAESDDVVILRTQLIESLSRLGDAVVIAEARRRYMASTDDSGAMPAALKKTILSVVAEHIDAPTWERMQQAARNEKTALIKDQLYRMLASAADATLAQRALELAISDEPGATNSSGMISQVARLHPELAFEFAVTHREALDERVDDSSRSRYYPGLASNSLKPDIINKLRAFADAHIAASARRPTETAIANISYRREVRKLRLPMIEAWLQKRGG